MFAMFLEESEKYGVLLAWVRMCLSPMMQCSSLVANSQAEQVARTRRTSPTLWLTIGMCPGHTLMTLCGADSPFLDPLITKPNGAPKQIVIKKL